MEVLLGRRAHVNAGADKVNAAARSRAMTGSSRPAKSSFLISN
jgi:hypothetical protein